MMAPDKVVIPAPSKSNRRNLFKLHSWVGFHFAFLMAVVLATGTIATVSNEIDWLIHADMRVTPGVEKVSWQTMEESIQAFAPNSSILGIFDMHSDYFAYRARTKDQYNGRQYIYVNQWTGEVTGATGLLTVQRFFRDFHRYLFTPKLIGLPIVGSMAFILLISLYTGLKTSRNWKTLMTRVRFDKGSRVLIGDAHKAAGLWSIWFILLMSITSIWYLAEFGFEISASINKDKSITFEPVRPKLTQERLNDIGPVIIKRSTDDIVDVTQRVFPELNVTSISFPSSPQSPIYVQGVRSNPILRPRANRLLLDPVSLEPLLIQRSEEISWVAWLNEVADPLHFGNFGGLITKLIWFVFGLGLTGLSVTGVLLTWRRLKSKSVSRTQLATLPILFLSFVVAYFFWAPSYISPSRPNSELSFYQKTKVGLDFELHISINEQSSSGNKIRLIINSRNSNANIKSISMTQAYVDHAISEPKILKLQSFSTSSVYIGELSETSLEKIEKIAFVIELNNGEKIDSDWPINLSE